MPLKLITAGGGSVILDANTTASNYTINVPAVNGSMVSTGDTGSVTSTMLNSTLDLSSKSVTLPSSAASMVKIADTGNITTGTSITIDNCFSATYRVYKVYCYLFAPSSGGSTTFSGLRLRTGGVTGADVTGNYQWRQYRHYMGHSVNEIDNNSNDPIFRLQLQTRYDYGNYYEWTIYAPYQSVRTMISGTEHGYHEQADVGFHHSLYGVLNTTDVCTGLRWYMYNSSFPTISEGRISVYGVKNALI